MSCRSVDLDNKKGFKKDVMHWLLMYCKKANNEECQGDIAPHALGKVLYKYIIPTLLHSGCCCNTAVGMFT